MFVIMSCLQQVPDEKSVEERVGEALRHAGTSVTVTTATDVLAFSVGAVTVRPDIDILVITNNIDEKRETTTTKKKRSLEGCAIAGAALKTF